MAPPCTIADCLAWATRGDGGAIDRFDAEVLLASVLDKNRSYLYTWLENKITDTQYTLFAGYVEKRGRGEPIAYLLGEKEFWSLKLEVNSSTLVPRPETELLVELALTHCFSEARVLDLGTGTGAIALALAHELSDIHVDAVDANIDAVALANRNKQRLNLKHVNIFQSSWFESVNAHYDIIVTNPPYVEANDPHLTQGDVQFEPRSALVAGTDGLADIRHICANAADFLHDNGWLIVEHGWNQAERVRNLFLQAKFDRVETVADYAGNDRVTMGVL